MFLQNIKNSNKTNQKTEHRNISRKFLFYAHKSGNVAVTSGGGSGFRRYPENPPSTKLAEITKIGIFQRLFG